MVDEFPIFSFKSGVKSEQNKEVREPISKVGE
jgi:hypothetical protein